MSFPEKMSVTEFEEAVFNLEEIRVIVRDKPYEKIGAFNYARKAAETTSISAWLENRILPLTNGRDVIVIDGSGRVPHGRTKVDKVRSSYS